jgi:hypothetical protein
MLIEAKCSSLQLYITPVIVSEWPFNHLIHLLLCKSHTRTILPVPPEPRYREPLLLKQIPKMDSCNWKRRGKKEKAITPQGCRFTFSDHVLCKTSLKVSHRFQKTLNLVMHETEQKEHWIERLTSILSSASPPGCGTTPTLCPFFIHSEILQSSPALATTKSAKRRLRIHQLVSDVSDGDTSNAFQIPDAKLLSQRRKIYSSSGYFHSTLILQRPKKSPLWKWAI